MADHQFFTLHLAMFTKVFTIILCILTGSIVVIVLYLLSGAPNTHKNGFKRLIRPNYVKSWHSLDVGLSTYRLAGYTKNQLFVSNLTDPLMIRSIDYDISNAHIESWSFGLKDLPKTSIVRIDSPWIDIFNSKQQKIVSYRLYHDSLIKINEDSYSVKPFDDGRRISGDELLTRTLNLTLHQYTLTGIKSLPPANFENATAIEKQIDGFLCTDGMMIYDPAISKIVYVYYYRNQFVILDSGLNLLHRVRTIDTVTQAQIKVYIFSSSAVTTFKGPSMPVNKRACVWKGRLYIVSGLLADNENRKSFSNNSITDVYDLNKEKYLFSFYIPQFGPFKINDFQVYDSLLIAVQGHFIVSYQIDQR